MQRTVFQALTLKLLRSINLPSDSQTVIAEAILIGNPASNRLNRGSPIETFEDDNLHSGRIALI